MSVPADALLLPFKTEMLRVITKCLSDSRGPGREARGALLSGSGGSGQLARPPPPPAPPSVLSMGIAEQYQNRPHLFLQLWKNTRVINLQGHWKTL